MNFNWRSRRIKLIDDKFTACLKRDGIRFQNIIFQKKNVENIDIMNCKILRVDSNIWNIWNWDISISYIVIEKYNLKEKVVGNIFVYDVLLIYIMNRKNI